MVILGTEKIGWKGEGIEGGADRHDAMEVAVMGM